MTFAVGVPPGLTVPAERTRGYRVESERSAPDRLLVHVAESGTPMPEPIFTMLCADLAEAVQPCPTPVLATLALLRRLQHWKLFFQRNPEGALSHEDGVGLFAEIEFLNTCMAGGFDADAMVAAWTGPLAQNQDFTFGTRAVEVKATVANDADTARITNARQLDSTGLAELFLRHSAYDFRAGAGTTLPDAVARTRVRLAAETSALIGFEDRLLAAGYMEPVTGAFATRGFTLRRHRHFRVEQGFPRLTEAVLPSGILDVAYSLALSGCLPFELDETAVMHAVQPSGTT